MESIKIILEKLSSYNVFNYLLPGVLFIFLTKVISGYDLIQENLLINAFLYYFTGMIVSRVGSIIIEPILKGIKFLNFKDYNQFVKANKKDGNLELLSEVNNTYRTIVSMLVLICFEYLYLLIKHKFNISHQTTKIIAISFTTILFLFSYRKQTNYISKRIDANLKD